MRNRTFPTTLLVFAVLLFVAAGCNGDDDDTADTTSTSSSTTEADTTTSSSSSTTSTTVFEPSRDNDFEAIVQELYDRQFELQANPDPENVEAIQAVFAPECDCYGEFLAGVQELERQGAHIEGAPGRAVAVELQRYDDETDQGLAIIPQARLTVEVESGGAHMVDAEGNTVSPASASGSVLFSILLEASGPDGRWRIADELFLREVDG